MKKDTLNIKNKMVNGEYINDYDEYDEFLDSVKKHFSSAISKGQKLFTTNVEGLYRAYIDNLPKEAQQHYTCTACRQFIEHFGGLVTQSEKGTIKSAVWDDKDVPEFFIDSVKEMKSLVEKSKIKGVFISDVKKLGTPITGEWTHLSVTLLSDMVHKSTSVTVGQLMAEKLEDFDMLTRGLEEYSLETIERAVALLQTGTLYRGDKCIGRAEWLRDLKIKHSNTRVAKTKENLVWLAVASAPTGFCHVRSSMLGTLLDSIVAGESIETLSRKFKEKMDPSVYNRAQVAPTAGNIAQAERLISELGLASALRRRYARFEEIAFFIWQNRHLAKQNDTKKTGVFSNITPKNVVNKPIDVNLPTSVMTWEKFLRTVLPTADNIEAKVDNTTRLMALVTALDEDAENILQWDNTFSWYYHGGIDGEIKRRVESMGGQYTNNEIRCSLIWENYTDLDLHCITPSGEHISFREKHSRCGGYLDIDENAGSGRTMKPVENIRWTKGLAREGRYQFYVNNFAERGSGATPYRVELEVNGKIFNFEGSALGNKRDETAFEFNYIKGQQPVIRNSSSCTSNDWNISDEFVKVTGITTSPNTWNKEQVNTSGNHIFFILDKCKDLSEGKGRGFFAEMLKPRLQEVRKTLEAYNAATPVEGVDTASACGLGYNKDSEWNLVLKVTSGSSCRLIKIDRID